MVLRVTDQHVQAGIGLSQECNVGLDHVAKRANRSVNPVNRLVQWRDETSC
jgi:hypothetical protein